MTLKNAVGRTMGNWYCWVAQFSPSKIDPNSDSSGINGFVMVVLTTWIGMVIFIFLLLLNEYVFDLIGAYLNLWPNEYANGNFRDLKNPITHIGIFVGLFGIIFGKIGHVFLKKNKITIPNPKNTILNFAGSMLVLFWPPLMVIFSTYLHAFVSACVINFATVMFFYKTKRFDNRY